MGAPIFDVTLQYVNLAFCLTFGDGVSDVNTTELISSIRRVSIGSQFIRIVQNWRRELRISSEN